MLAGEPLLDDLRELLDDADELDLAHLHVGVALTKRCAVASKWAQRANNALRRRTGLSALEALRAEATSGANSAGMGVRLEQLSQGAVDALALAVVWVKNRVRVRFRVG